MFEAYGEETETEERFSFAGSDDLAAQIRQGAPVDVFAAANTSLPDALSEEGLVEEPANSIANELVLAVPVDSPFAGRTARRCSTSAGLHREQPDLVIGAEGVPVGDYTREVLSLLPAPEEDGILSKVRSEEPDVKSIVAKLVTGAADMASSTHRTWTRRAASSSRSSSSEAQAGRRVRRRDRLRLRQPGGAQEFIDGLLDGAGRAALLDAEFLPPEGE